MKNDRNLTDNLRVNKKCYHNFGCCSKQSQTLSSE